MNIQLILNTLKEHAQEEIRIHKEVFADTDKGIKDLLKKHLDDTMRIHKAFWRKLKKVAKLSNN